MTRVWQKQGGNALLEHFHYICRSRLRLRISSENTRLVHARTVSNNLNDNVKILTV